MYYPQQWLEGNMTKDNVLPQISFFWPFVPKYKLQKHTNASKKDRKVCVLPSVNTFGKSLMENA